MHHEARIYVGDSGNHAFDGYAGFRRGRQYQLTYKRRGDGTVAIALNYHAHVRKEAEFERWWVPVV